MNTLFRDVNASIVVFFVALPLCLGISLASNAPLASGLIAGIIGGIVVGVFGGSKVAVSGPAAGLTVIVATGIKTLGSFEAFCQALMLAGLIQILFSFLGVEKISRFVPISVTKGLLAAIGIIICYKQLPYTLGLSLETFYSWNIFDEINIFILILSLSGAASLLLWNFLQRKKSWAHSIPSVFVSVLVTSFFAFLLTLSFKTSLDPSSFVRLPKLHFDNNLTPFRLGFSYPLLLTAISVALIATLETLLCLEASLALDTQKRGVSRKRELAAQGFANFLSGLLAGLPITAVIVRTSANIDAGAKSQLSAIFHGLWLLVFVLFLSMIAERIPIAALAVVLIFVGLKLFSFSVIADMKSKGKAHFVTFFFTLGTILALDILWGVALGCIFYFLFQKYSKVESFYE